VGFNLVFVSKGFANLAGLANLAGFAVGLFFTADAVAKERLGAVIKIGLCKLWQGVDRGWLRAMGRVAIGRDARRETPRGRKLASMSLLMKIMVKVN